jgi:hypothetical protein
LGYTDVRNQPKDNYEKLPGDQREISCACNTNEVCQLEAMYTT